MPNKKRDRKQPPQNPSPVPNPQRFQLHGFMASPYLIDHFASSGVFPKEARADGKLDWDALLMGTSRDLCHSEILRGSYESWKTTLPKPMRLKTISKEDRDTLVLQFTIMQQHGIVKFRESAGNA